MIDVFCEFFDGFDLYFFVLIDWLYEFFVIGDFYFDFGVRLIIDDFLVYKWFVVYGEILDFISVNFVVLYIF